MSRKCLSFVLFFALVHAQAKDTARFRRWGLISFTYESGYLPLWWMFASLVYPTLQQPNAKDIAQQLQAMEEWEKAHDKDLEKIAKNSGDFYPDDLSIPPEAEDQLRAVAFPPARQLFDYGGELLEKDRPVFAKFLNDIFQAALLYEKKNRPRLRKSLDIGVNSSPRKVRLALETGAPALYTDLRATPATVYITPSFVRSLIESTFRTATASGWPGRVDYIDRQLDCYDNFGLVIVGAQLRNAVREFKNSSELKDAIRSGVNDATVYDISFTRTLMFLLWHEIAHVVLGHQPPLDKNHCDSSKQNELDADSYAAFLTRLISGNLDDPDDPGDLSGYDPSGFQTFLTAAYRIAGFDTQSSVCPYPSTKERSEVSLRAWTLAEGIMKK